MPGVQVFSYVNIAKETTRGTPVAPTRQLYPECVGVIVPSFGLNKHDGENAGLRNRIRRVTSTSEDVAFAFRSVAGVAFDELPIFFAMLNGTAAAVGAGADKTWTQTPSLTGANSPVAYTLDVGDDVQNWRLQYAMFRKIKLSIGLNGLTQVEVQGFAQRAIKTAKANPAANTAVKIPADLWAIKFAANFAGLGAAAVQTNFLLGAELDIDTGLKWRHYLDGNLYGSQHVETDVAAKVTLKAESTALAISEFYDKAVAGTLSYIRLKATGAALGGSAYSSQLDLAVAYDVPAPIAEQDDGINVYNVTADLANDGTNAIIPVTVASLTALP